MMDHERTEKELEEIFEEIQRSYRSFVEGVIALQEQTLRLARDLIEAPAAEEAGGRQATLEDLAAEGEKQRTRFEQLARKSSEAYMKVLKAPADYHHKVEEARAELEEVDRSQ